MVLFLFFPLHIDMLQMLLVACNFSSVDKAGILSYMECSINVFYVVITIIFV